MGKCPVLAVPKGEAQTLKSFSFSHVDIGVRLIRGGNSNWDVQNLLCSAHYADVCSFLQLLIGQWWLTHGLVGQEDSQSVRPGCFLFGLVWQGIDDRLEGMTYCFVSPQQDCYLGEVGCRSVTRHKIYDLLRDERGETARVRSLNVKFGLLPRISPS